MKQQSFLLTLHGIYGIVITQYTFDASRVEQARNAIARKSSKRELIAVETLRENRERDKILQRKLSASPTSKSFIQQSCRQDPDHDKAFVRMNRSMPQLLKG